MEMSPKDWDDLNRRAAQSFCVDKFCGFTKPKSPDKGDRVKAIYTFQSIQRSYKNNVVKYDIQVPFSIIKYKSKDDPQPLAQIDLFEKAHELSREDVTASNEWYHLRLSDKDEKLAQA